MISSENNFIGYFPIFDDYFTVDIARFVIITALILIVSFISNFYSPLLIIHIRKAFLAIYRRLRSNKFTTISITLLVLSLSLFVDYTVKEDDKIRGNFYSMTLSEDLSLVITTKGQPASKTFGSDSTLCRLGFTKSNGWDRPYVECVVYFRANKLFAVMSDGKCEHHGWSFNRIIEKYGSPTSSWSESDGSESHAYRKYNLLFRMLGNGRENEEVVSEGMINYDTFMKMINDLPK